MNKALVIGIIVTAIILIGIVSTISYNNSVPNKDNMPLETENPTNTTGKHFTVELKESVGVSENP